MADDGRRDEPISRQPGRPEADRPTPRPAQPDPTSRGLHAEISPRHVQLIPGESQTVSITVRNLGSVVDEITLTITGDAAAWARVAPDSLNIYPGTEGQATIRFAPPRAPQPRAGLLELELAVTSRSRPEASTVYSTSLEVGAFDNLAAAAEGSSLVTGMREAVMPIKLRNLGNRPATVNLQASELPTAAVFLSSASVDVQPGGEAMVWATVRPKRQMLFGAPVIHPFTVYASSDFSAPIAIDGRMEQHARFGRRRLGLAALLAAGALVLVVAVAVVGSGLLGGATPSPAPSATLSAVGSNSPGTSTTVIPSVSIPVESRSAPPSQPRVSPPTPTTGPGGPTPPQTLTPLPPPTTTGGPTPTRAPAPTPMPPFAYAAAHAWSLDSSNVSPDDQQLAGTLFVDEGQGRAFWYLYSPLATNVVACEGSLDMAFNPNILPDRAGQWMGFGDVNQWTRQLCGLLLQPPDAPLPYTWAVSAKPGPTAAADRFVMHEPLEGTVLTWRPLDAGQYTFCALEGEVCRYLGNGRVTYGAYGLTTTIDWMNGMICENRSFAEGATPQYEGGDPYPGIPKYCLYLPLTGQ